MPLDPSVDKIRVRGRVLTQAGSADRPPTLFPTALTLVNKIAHARIRLSSIDPSTNQTSGIAAAPFYFNNSTGDWWIDVIAVDDADVLPSGQTQWGQWGVEDNGTRYYVEPKLSSSSTFYGDPVTGAPLAQGSGGIRTVWLDDLAALYSPTVLLGQLGFVVAPTVVTLANQSGTVAIDGTAGRVQIVNLTGSVTSWSLTNLAQLVGETVEVHFVQDVTGGRTLAGAAAPIKLAGGALTLTATGGRRDVVRFRVLSTNLAVEIDRSMNIPG